MQNQPAHADTNEVVKWSIRDRWGKLTEKKELKPDVKEMLLQLDGVYEKPSNEQPAASGDAPRTEDASNRTVAKGSAVGADELKDGTTARHEVL